MKKKTKIILFSALSLILCAAIVLSVLGVFFGLFQGNFNTYLRAVKEAKKRETFSLPENASLRTAPDYEKETKFFINIDETSQVWDYEQYLKAQEEITEDDLAFYVKPYYDTQVTDIMFSICGQTSSTKSEYITWRGDKIKQTEENGKAVDYSTIKYWWYTLQEKDIDPVPTWLKVSKEHNINPWLSVRMNDCHDSGEETSFLRGDLFYIAKENGWMIGEEYGYYHTCYDYSVPQIREIMLNYIREQIFRYDAYGLELDFQREIYCFDYLHADNATIVDIMNGFIRDVNTVVKEAETKWGHDIKINVRLMRDIDQCKVFGFDARTWAQENLVDSITVTPRFSTCDSDMDIRAWKETLPNIEIYAGIETLVRPDGTCVDGAVAGASVTRGYAAEYLSEGADGIYLFNYFAYPHVDRNEEIYTTCGSALTAADSYRRHVMTFQDVVPEGATGYRPLPVASLKSNPATLSQKTGYIPSGATIRVYIGFARKIDKKKVTVTVNGSGCDYNGEACLYSENENGTGPIKNGYLPQGSYLYSFTVSDPAKVGNVSYVTVKNDKITPLIITYLEVEIVPAA